MQLLTDSGLVPFGEPSPAGGPGSAEQRSWQAVPADAGADDVQAAFQRGAVIGALAAGIAETPWMHRKERLQPLPQLVGQNLLTHTKILESPAVPAKSTRRLILN